MGTIQAWIPTLSREGREACRAFLMTISGIPNLVFVWPPWELQKAGAGPGLGRGLATLQECAVSILAVTAPQF